MDMNLSKLQERVKDREAWHSAVHRVTKSRIQLSDWTTTITRPLQFVCISSVQFSSVQSLSCVWLFAHQASLSITNSWSPPKPMSIESVMPSKHHILCCPLLLLPSIFSHIRVFSNESALRIRWPKCWSFSFSIRSFNEYSGLISFMIHWFDFLAVQAPFKSLLQHHSSKVSILQHLAFYIVQLSHPYMTTGKTIALTRRTFVSKVMSLLFNTLGLSYLFFQGANIFSFHGCSH